MKAIKSDKAMSKKGRQFLRRRNQNWRQKRSPGFSRKNRGVTPSVAAPGVTHPSDALQLATVSERFIPDS